MEVTDDGIEILLRPHSVEKQKAGIVLKLIPSSNVIVVRFLHP